MGFVQKPVFEAADEDDTLVKNKLDESRDSQVKLVQEFMAGIIKDLKKEKLQDQADRDAAHKEFLKLKAELKQQIQNLKDQIASLDEQKAGHMAQRGAEKKDKKANTLRSMQQIKNGLAKEKRRERRRIVCGFSTLSRCAVRTELSRS